MAKYSGGGSARDSDPETSHDAANQDFTKLESEVVNTVRRFGPPRGPKMCVVEIWHRMPDHSIDSISPRMTRLVEKGALIQHPKEPRGNRYGNLRAQLVYSVKR